MSTASYRELQDALWAQKKFICIGLDPQRSKIPQCLNPKGEGLVEDDDIEVALIRLVCDIIDATAGIASVFKPNFSFYVGKGWRGIRALETIGAYLRHNYPLIPFILDHKGGDIGDTNAEWVTFAFDILGAHAVTLHNYMGWKAMQPYLNRGDKGCYILCRTSNPGADEFQGLTILEDAEFHYGEDKLFTRVGRSIARPELWNAKGNCGAVAGASKASIEDLARVRAAVGRGVPLLSPGVGKQGGDAGQAYLDGSDEDGSCIVINVSSAVIHASAGDDYAEAGVAVALKYHYDVQAGPEETK